jgi:hypothetical protein
MADLVPLSLWMGSWTRPVSWSVAFNIFPKKCVVISSLKRLVASMIWLKSRTHGNHGCVLVTDCRDCEFRCCGSVCEAAPYCAWAIEPATVSSVKWD